MPSVLFVCVENSFRSVMAEALFNAIAPPGWRAHSAGVDAKGKTVNPLAFSLMEEIGIVVTKTRPRQVAPENIKEAWRVVTFGCLDRCPPGAAGKNDDWPVPGSTGKTDEELRAIRTDLQARVEDLIRRLPK
ncbi:MAG TPA: low molecular weight phosphatase family protein [Thermoplasmata archaeon]|nr:low molecular weight phosphatase family protein [Thermoplasmata archaeon]